MKKQYKLISKYPLSHGDLKIRDVIRLMAALGKTEITFLGRFRVVLSEPLSHGYMPVEGFHFVQVFDLENGASWKTDYNFNTTLAEAISGMLFRL